MAIKRKGSSKKIYIAIILLVVLIAASAAVIYATRPVPVKATVGVHTGDTFTYSLMGVSNLTSLDAVDTPGFSQYNDTEYFKVTITDVNGTSVSLDTMWRFKNGTELPAHQTIDLSTGAKTDQNGFWAIYASNLNPGDLLRPSGSDGVKVNASATVTYFDSTRERNFLTIGAESYLATDPTQSTRRYDTTIIYFDKPTGMLQTLIWVTDYNNPLMREVITWELINSSVWTVL
jgi:hypothetical protein